MKANVEKYKDPGEAFFEALSFGLLSAPERYHATVEDECGHKGKASGNTSEAAMQAAIAELQQSHNEPRRK